MRFVLAILAFLLAAPAMAAPPAYVQGSTHQNGNTSTPTAAVTLASPVASGDAVIVTFCGTSAGANTMSVTDDKSNTYTVQYQFGAFPDSAASNYACAVAYALNVTNAPQTITATANVGLSFLTIVADEFSGVKASGAVDGSAGQAVNNPGTGTDAVTSGSLTTAANGDLIYSFGVSINSSGFSNGTGFTARQSVTATFYTQSLIQASAGAVAGTFTAANANDSTIVYALALQPATAPTGGPAHNQLMTGM
jgi:hypothetical protein